MGLISSRLNLEGLNASRRRSQQEETLYSYSLNKNHFSNYFLLGGERFEVNDPDYLFGDNCDLNFLSCTKPYAFPYKQVQQNLIADLESKQKAINKVSSRVNRLSSPFNILTTRHRQVISSRKNDTQNQSSLGSKKFGSEPSHPLVMLINIRKETLRLIKSSNVHNIDSDANSLTNSISTTTTADQSRRNVPARKGSLSKSIQRQQTSPKRHSAASSRATTSTLNPNDGTNVDGTDDETDELNPNNLYNEQKKIDSDIGSLVSATSSIRSGYTSVKGGGFLSQGNSKNVDEYDGAINDEDDDDDLDFKDALNDTTNLSINDDDISEKTQQQKSLLSEIKPTKEDSDIRITMGPLEQSTTASNQSDNKTTDAKNVYEDNRQNSISRQHNFNNSISRKRSSILSRRSNKQPLTKTTEFTRPNSTNKVYNIEFKFDTEVDCSIRIFYFCTREVTSTGITYKPQHATYKSRVFNYKKGLNQKFDQQEHTFQPYLFDEDLLIYKPLDMDGNYNSGAVFPIVIHCVALEGSLPRQSHSLVATIEKSQLDDSYSIKPLKQLIFVDGVQYIMQDIYGIEHKPLTPPTNKSKLAHASAGGSLSNTKKSNKNTADRETSTSTNTRMSGSMMSRESSNGSTSNLSDTASMAGFDLSLACLYRQNRGSLNSSRAGRHNESNFECVICMSEERDTMLLPCRHLCLCSSCAQSLRYQANTCPICRCPFKAALNFRTINQRQSINHPEPASAGSSSVTNEAATKGLVASLAGANIEPIAAAASSTTITEATGSTAIVVAD